MAVPQFRFEEKFSPAIIDEEFRSYIDLNFSNELSILEDLDIMDSDKSYGFLKRLIIILCNNTKVWLDSATRELATAYGVSTDVDTPDFTAHLTQVSLDLLLYLSNYTDMYSLTASNNDSGVPTMTSKYTFEEVAHLCDRNAKQFPMLCGPRRTMKAGDSRYVDKSIPDSIYCKKIFEVSDDCNSELHNIAYIQGSIPLKLDEITLAAREKTPDDFDNHDDLLNFEIKQRLRRDVAKHIMDNEGVFFTLPKFDSRGRLYAGNYLVNYQGTDYDKALVELANQEVVTLPKYVNVRAKNGMFKAYVKGKVMFSHFDPEICYNWLVAHGHHTMIKEQGNLRWVKFHLANLLGWDKLNFEDRVARLNLYIDDLMAPELLELAEEEGHSFQYAKAVRDYQKVIDGLPVGMVVHQDATMQVGQIGAVLSGNLTDMVNTNLVDPNTRYDPYTLIYEEMKSDPRLRLNTSITRKLCKSAIMPSLYFSSIAAEEVFYGSNQEETETNVRVFWDAMKAVMPGTYNVMSCIRAILNTDKSVLTQSWIMPDNVKAMSHPMTKGISNHASYTISSTNGQVSFTNQIKIRKSCGIELGAK